MGKEVLMEKKMESPGVRSAPGELETFLEHKQEWEEATVQLLEVKSDQQEEQRNHLKVLILSTIQLTNEWTKVTGKKSEQILEKIF